MAVLIDDDDTYFRPRGVIGIAIEQFGLGRVNVRNVWLKQLRSGSEVSRDKRPPTPSEQGVIQ
jgi:hypothetical protein